MNFGSLACIASSTVRIFSCPAKFLFIIDNWFKFLISIILQTQMHCLAPFGSDLADGMHEDNMTWNFIAGLTVAREILENYGCVLRVISPRRPDAIIGTGGSRIEIWLPTSQTELSEITEGA